MLIRPVMKRAAGLLLALSLAGCLEGAAPEGRMFRDSATAIDTASAGLLDELANAEREIATLALNALRGGSDSRRGCVVIGAASNAIRDFCPDDAMIQGGVGDPPGTARLRRGLAAVNAQALLMVALAEQAPGVERDSRLGRLTVELNALAAAANGPGAEVYRPLGLTAVTQGLQPLATGLMTADDPNAIRALLLANEQATEALITVLRASPTVFFREQANQVSSLGRGRGPQAAALRRLETERQLLANYLLLLNRSAQNWRSAAQLLRHGRPAAFTALSDTAVSTQIEAESIRRARAR